MLHLEILGLRLAIQLHDFSKRGIVVLGVVCINQHATSTPPQVHALGRGRLAFFPAGICKGKISFCPSDAALIPKEEQDLHCESWRSLVASKGATK